jgi:hypothetical protein
MGGTEVSMAADRARAETYLRLLAEAELRRALTLPRYQPPGPPTLPAPVRAARAMLHPVSRLARMASMAIAARSEPAQVMQTPAGRAAMRSVTVADRKIRAMAATGRPAAGPVLPRIARLTWQIRWRSRRAHRGLLPGWRRDGEPAMTLLRQVRQVASALVTVGAISDAVAQSVLQSLTDALLVRAKIDANRAGGPWWPTSPAPALPAGLVRVAPVGASVLLGLDGRVGPGWLLTLVLAPDRASITAAGRLAGGEITYDPAGNPSPHSPLTALHQLTAADDQGAVYQVRPAHGHGGGDDTWSWVFDVSPVPPPGIRWLDITAPSCTAPVRVNLGAGVPSYQQAGPAEIRAGVGMAGGCCAADWVLDAWSVRLLGQATQTGQASPQLLSGLAEVAGALQAVGALRPGCAALGRLASLSGQLSLSFPASLRESASRAGLPEAWSGVLAERGAADGLDRAAPVAAVLPELDGARFILAGLMSTNHSATLHVLAWGWQPDHRPTPGGPRFSWWARDNVGRWHVGTQGGGRFDGGRVDLELQFKPPIHPDATALGIFVIGPASAAGVTVPLGWQAAQ